MKNNSLKASPELPKFGLLSIAFGVVAILSVIGEYETLLISWLGYESPILSVIFVALPVIAVSLAVLGILYSKNAMMERGSNRALGVIGLIISFLTFPSCCLLFAFFFIASGGLMGG
jgi:hypothetical protein